MDKDRVLKALTGCSPLPKEVNSEIEMLNLLVEGLPTDALRVIKSLGIVDDAELRFFIAPRTLARRKDGKRLTADESDLIARIARIHDFAVEVFSDEMKARKWLRTPNRALNGKHPLALLRTDYGARIVESTLGRIAHGIFS